MKSLFRRLRLFDYLIFASIITVALWAGFFLYAKDGTAKRLVIEAPGGKWIYPVSDTRTVTIPGLLGNTVIRIENGIVFITDSPCPNKTCMSAAVLKNAGDWNACLPNQVFLHLEGSGTEEIILPAQ
ncbi:MAG: NusG domain II-containing protein [Treponema sp.]